MAQPPVLNCKQNAYTGRSVLVDVAFGCGDVPDPKLLNYMPFGAMKTKSLSMSQDTVDATADDTQGFFRDMIGTYKDFTFSGDGIARAKDGSRSNVVMLTKYFMTNQQANVWTRVTYPDITVWFYGLISDMSREAPDDDVATYSFEVVATSSDHGVVIADTPDTRVAVTGLTVTPPTVEMSAIGETQQLVVAVLPAEANQSALYTSGDELVATVDVSGLVRAVGEGSTTITAYSADDMTKEETVTVTVTIS